MSDSTIIAPLDGDSLYDATGAIKKNNDLDKDMFLNLMMTQLKYQDPFDPMDNKESLAQLAQFTSLEQMTNLYNSQQKQTAFSMIGKTVMGNLYNDTTGAYELVAGQVNSVRVKGSELYLLIGSGNGEKEMPMSNVTAITDQYVGALDDINNNVAASQGLALVGQTIQAITVDANGNLGEFVEGVVDYVKFVNGVTVLVVNGKEVYGGEVISVSDRGLLINSQDITASTTDIPAQTGKITKVLFEDNKSYIMINDEKFPVDKLVDLIDANVLKSKERTIITDRAEGKIDEILVENGNVYVKVDGVKLTMDEVRTGKESKETDKDDDDDD